MYILGRI